MRPKASTGGSGNTIPCIGGAMSDEQCRSSFASTTVGG
jgi:hypothetical protein